MKIAREIALLATLPTVTAQTVDEYRKELADLITAKLTPLVEHCQNVIDSAVTDADACPICLGDVDGKHPNDCSIVELRRELEKIR